MSAVIESLPLMLNRAESSHAILQLLTAMERTQQAANTQVLQQASLQKIQEVQGKDREEEIEDQSQLSGKNRFRRRGKKAQPPHSPEVMSDVPVDPYRGTIVDVKV